MHESETQFGVTRQISRREFFSKFTPKKEELSVLATEQSTAPSIILSFGGVIIGAMAGAIYASSRNQGAIFESSYSRRRFFKNSIIWGSVIGGYSGAVIGKNTKK